MTHAWTDFLDEELARRARAGGAAAFEELVRRHQAPLLRFLSKRFPSRRDAEDILQDTFLKAWQALHQYDDAFPFRTWLYTIAYRLAVSRGRRAGEATSSLPDADLRSHDPAPPRAAEQDDDRAHLWRQARRLLSDEQFTALWLHYVDDLPAGDVARVLNRSWVSVKTMMHRARKKLLPHLVDHDPRPAAGQAPLLPHSDLAAPCPAVQAGEP
jgi:RNA polymerase sigma-70 factor (ECF subfamily)